MDTRCISQGGGVLASTEVYGRYREGGAPIKQKVCWCVGVYDGRYREGRCTRSCWPATTPTGTVMDTCAAHHKTDISQL